VLAIVMAVGFGVATERANAAYSVHIGSNTLTVTGDSASDVLALRLAPGDSHTLILDVGNNGSADFTANRLLFTQIVVNAGTGNDKVLIDETNGAFTGEEATTLNGQGGDDTLTGGRGPETLIGADGNDHVTGARGNDLVSLGTGNDTFTWNAGDGNDSVEAGTGADTLVFNGGNGDENIALGPNGSRLAVTRDVGFVDLDVNAVETVSVNTLGGTDHVGLVPLAGTGVTRVNVNLASTLGGASGDGAADTVTVDATAAADTMAVSAASGVVQANTGPASVFVSHTEPANDKLEVDTLAGNDSVSIFSGVTSLLALSVDGGADTDTIVPTGTSGADSISAITDATPPTIDISWDGGATAAHVLCEKLDIQGLGGADTILGGGNLASSALLQTLTEEGGPGTDTLTGSDGNDTLIGGDDNDQITGGRGADTALLGNGNDTFVWNPGDSSDIVEGQAGADTLDFHGANVSEVINLSANGSRLLFTRDVGSVVMDVNGVETVDVHLLGGSDTVTVNPLAGTSVTRVATDLAAFAGGNSGDGSADRVTVQGGAGADAYSVSAVGGVPQVDTGAASVSVSTAEPGSDELQVNTLAGNDTVTLFGGVTPLVALSVDGGADTDTVVPTGTDSGDAISAVADVTPPTIDVSWDGGASVARVLCETVDIQGLGGGDALTAGTGLATITKLIEEGGPGTDTLTGGDGNDTLIGGDDNDQITGARGTDTAFLGNGNDTFVWNPGDGSDIVEGQAGADTLDFHGANVAEVIDLSANGSRLFFTRDVGSVVMDVNGVETVDVHLLGGADKLTVNSLAGTDVTRVDADLAAFAGGNSGDGSPDTVIVNGTAGADTVGIAPSGIDVRVKGLAPTLFISQSEAANDALTVNTLAGNDSVTANVGLAGLIRLTIDGGPDADTLTGGDGGDTLIGEDGNDSIRGVSGNDLLYGGPGVDYLNGGPGADQFSCGGAGDTLVTDPSDTIGPDC
jgi:Ca2+-binding RTX toxin-like protein